MGKSSRLPNSGKRPWKGARIVSASVAVILVSIVLWRALSVYYATGIGWDFVAHYLAALSMTRPGFFSSIHLYPNNIYVENGGTYYELGRAPLSYPIIALLIELVGSALSMPAFIALAILLVAAGTAFVSGALKQDRLILLSALMAPYVIAFTIFDDGSEDILALGLLLFAVGLLLRKSEYSGVALALAGLAKYTSLVFLPMLLLLGDFDRAKRSYAMFIITTSPWLILNTFFFGFPSASYFVELNVFGGSNALAPTVSFAVLRNLAYPAAFVAVAALAWFLTARIHGPGMSPARIAAMMRRKAAKIGRTGMVLAAFLMLAVAGYVLVARGTGYGVAEERYGEFLYLALALLCSVAIGSLAKAVKRSSSRWGGAFCAALPIAMAASSAVLVVSLYGAATPEANVGISTFSPGLERAVGQIDGMGLGGCRMISNIWPMLLYYNISAYPPYYTNRAMSGYPAVIYSQGVADYNATVLANRTRLGFGNLTIYVRGGGAGACG